MKQFALIALVIMGLVGLSGCGEKAPAAEIKAAQDSLAAAQAANIDPANADFKNATDTMAKAQAELDKQGKAWFSDYTQAKKMLADVKASGDKAVADKKAADEAKAKADADTKAKAEAAAAAKKKGAKKK